MVRVNDVPALMTNTNTDGKDRSTKAIRSAKRKAEPEPANVPSSPKRRVTRSNAKNTSASSISSNINSSISPRKGW